MADKPHLVIFNADQWRGDVMGHLGHPAAVTPNLDRLVETDAVSFARTHTQNPVCTPSRCCFMSGWYPHVRGHRSMKRMLRQPDENNLLKTLKDGGYYVWWGGKNDLVPAQHGFDDYCHVKYSRGYNGLTDPDLEPPRPLYATDRVDAWRHKGTDDYYSFFVGKIDKGDAPYYRDSDWAAVEGAIEMIRSAPADQPLCIYLCLAYPHPPYGVEEPWFSMIERDRIPPRIGGPENWSGKAPAMHDYHDALGMDTWTEDRWTELRAVYYGMAARVDHQVGLIVEALKEAGMYDQTAMFFFSDHGDFAGDYGLVEKHQVCFEDCLTHVPMVVKPPRSHAAQPRVTRAMAELIDMPATVEELSGLRMPQVHFGRSLLPVVTGQTDEHRDAVFCEGGRLEAESHVAEGDTQARPDPDGIYYPRQNLQATTVTAMDKSVMMRTDRYKLIKRVEQPDELYDLEADPAEVTNRLDDPAMAEVRRDLEGRMLDWYLRTSDVVPAGLDKRE